MEGSIAWQLSRLPFDRLALGCVTSCHAEWLLGKGRTNQWCLEARVGYAKKPRTHISYIIVFRPSHSWNGVSKCTRRRKAGEAWWMNQSVGSTKAPGGALLAVFQ